MLAGLPMDHLVAVVAVVVVAAVAAAAVVVDTNPSFHAAG